MSSELITEQEAKVILYQEMIATFKHPDFFIRLVKRMGEHNEVRAETVLKGIMANSEGMLKHYCRVVLHQSSNSVIAKEAAKAFDTIAKQPRKNGTRKSAQEKQLRRLQKREENKPKIKMGFK